MMVKFRFPVDASGFPQPLIEFDVEHDAARGREMTVFLFVQPGENNLFDLFFQDALGFGGDVFAPVF